MQRDELGSRLAPRAPTRKAAQLTISANLPELPRSADRGGPDLLLSYSCCVPLDRGGDPACDGNFRRTRFNGQRSSCLCCLVACPGLGDFHASHPEIDLHIVTSRVLANFEADGIDVAIRHGLGRWKGLRADRIAAVRLIPVCSKALLRGRPRPTRAKDLAALPLLLDAQRRDWALWFQALGVHPIPKEALIGPSLDDQMLLIQAAASGRRACQRGAGTPRTRTALPGQSDRSRLATGIRVLASLSGRQRPPAKVRCNSSMAIDTKRTGRSDGANAAERLTCHGWRRNEESGRPLSGRNQMAVASVTKITAASSEGFDAAVREGLARASKTVRGITGLHVIEHKASVENGKIDEYRVTMEVTFILEN